MLTINLLPAIEKKSIELEAIRKIIRLFSLTVAAIFFIGSSLMLTTVLPVVLEQRELKRSLELEKEATRILKISETTNYLRKTKENIGTVRSQISSPPTAIQILESIISDKNPGISINDLNVRKGGELNLTGFAVKRNDLLNFEKKLRISGKFQEIFLPLSNIVRETSINFTLRGRLKQIYAL